MAKITLLLFILALPLFLSIISAESSFTFTQGSVVDLKIPVFTTTNAQATNAVDCYLTARDRFQNIIVNNQQMTWNTGGIYNYTIADLDELGEYPCSIACSDGVDNGFSSFVFEITATGRVLTPAESNINTSAVYFLLLLGIVFIVFGFFTMEKGFWGGWTGIFAIILGFVFLYYDLSKSAIV